MVPQDRVGRGLQVRGPRVRLRHEEYLPQKLHRDGAAGADLLYPCGVLVRGDRQAVPHTRVQERHGRERRGGIAHGGGGGSERLNEQLAAEHDNKCNIALYREPYLHHRRDRACHVLLRPDTDVQALRDAAAGRHHGRDKKRSGDGDKHARRDVHESPLYRHP